MCWLVLTFSLTQFRIRWKKVTMEELYMLDWALGKALGIFLVSQPIVSGTTPSPGGYGPHNRKASLVNHPASSQAAWGTNTHHTPLPQLLTVICHDKLLDGLAWLPWPDDCGVALWGRINPLFLTLLLVWIFYHTNRNEARAEYNQTV